MASESPWLQEFVRDAKDQALSLSDSVVDLGWSLVSCVPQGLRVNAHWMDGFQEKMQLA